MQIDVWINADRGVMISTMCERISKKYNLLGERMDAGRSCW